MSTTTSMNEQAEPKVEWLDRVLAISATVGKRLAMPVVGFAAFLLLWSVAAQNIDTSLGKFPGPQAVWQQFGAGQSARWCHWRGTPALDRHDQSDRLLSL